MSIVGISWMKIQFYIFKLCYVLLFLKEELSYPFAICGQTPRQHLSEKIAWINFKKSLLYFYLEPHLVSR